VIELRDERYSRLVVEVEDPPATVATIQERLGGKGTLRGIGLY
jgi:hypothetical protein